MDLESSPCILPAAEKTHSTPADEAGAAKYTILLHHQFTILARLGHLGSFSFHQLSTLMLMSVLRVGEGLLQLVERQRLALGSAAASFSSGESCRRCCSRCFDVLLTFAPSRLAPWMHAGPAARTHTFPRPSWACCWAN